MTFETVGTETPGRPGRSGRSWFPAAGRCRPLDASDHRSAVYRKFRSIGAGKSPRLREGLDGAGSGSRRRRTDRRQPYGKVCDRHVRDIRTVRCTTRRSASSGRSFRTRHGRPPRRLGRRARSSAPGRRRRPRPQARTVPRGLRLGTEEDEVATRLASLGGSLAHALSTGGAPPGTAAAPQRRRRAAAERGADRRAPSPTASARPRSRSRSPGTTSRTTTRASACGRTSPTSTRRPTRTSRSTSRSTRTRRSRPS